MKVFLVKQSPARGLRLRCRPFLPVFSLPLINAPATDPCLPFLVYLSLSNLHLISSIALILHGWGLESCVITV